MQRSNQFDQLSELGQHENSRRGIWSRDLSCDHIPEAVVQGIRGGRGKYRNSLTQRGGMISNVCRDHFPKAVVQGIRLARGKCRCSLTHGGGGISKLWRYLINSIKFSELGQHGKSRSGKRSRLLRSDHIPKAVVQGIRGGRGKCRHCLTQRGGRISKCAEI